MDLKTNNLCLLWPIITIVELLSLWKFVPVHVLPDFSTYNLIEYQKPMI